MTAPRKKAPKQNEDAVHNDRQVVVQLAVQLLIPTTRGYSHQMTTVHLRRNGTNTRTCTIFNLSNTASLIDDVDNLRLMSTCVMNTI